MSTPRAQPVAISSPIRVSSFKITNLQRHPHEHSDPHCHPSQTVRTLHSWVRCKVSPNSESPKSVFYFYFSSFVNIKEKVPRPAPSLDRGPKKEKGTEAKGPARLLLHVSPKSINDAICLWISLSSPLLHHRPPLCRLLGLRLRV